MLIYTLERLSNDGREICCYSVAYSYEHVADQALKRAFKDEILFALSNIEEPTYSEIKEIIKKEREEYTYYVTAKVLYTDDDFSKLSNFN